MLLAIGLSWAWLLPNHSHPWLGFHGDAWAAIVLACVGLLVLWHVKCTVMWHWVTIPAALLSVIPLGQYVTGLVPVFGIAWINSAYLFGFLLALLVGAAWEKAEPAQCGDFLFLAVGLASVVSVGLQLHQLFDLDAVGPWILYSVGTRHYANMAQPNQLASLLLLGLLACGWGYYRKHLGANTATGIAAFLLFGVALTESRTGWLNIVLLVTMVIVWRRLAPSKIFVWVVLSLGVFFVFCVLTLPLFYNLFWGGFEVRFRTEGVGKDPRWIIWIMFLKGALLQPLQGYGWGQIPHAQFLMLHDSLNLGGLFTSSHNLFIDLILWSGVPVGVGISVALAWWVVSVVRRIEGFSQLILFSFVVVLGTHAMLEFPLQYAYFLLPAGLVMGCLNTSVSLRVALHPSKYLTALVPLVAIACLVITIRDYVQVETSFYGLRFEQKKIPTSIPPTPPDVIALTQWRDYIAFARMKPTPNQTTEEMAAIRGLVTTMPSGLVMSKFAATLAINDQPVEAQLWLKRICLILSPELCEVNKVEWAKQAQTNKSIAAVPWPSTPD